MEPMLKYLLFKWLQHSTKTVILPKF